MRRSSGDTTVRETAPATPPAMNEATIGWPRAWRVSVRKLSGFIGMGEAGRIEDVALGGGEAPSTGGYIAD